MSKNSNIIIAIDGFSSSGKSTLAKDLAHELNYVYIDSGAMYRAVARYILDCKIDINDTAKIISSLSEIKIEIKNEVGKNTIYLNGKDVTASLRVPEITDIVSEVARISEVREKLVEMQRSYGDKQGIVMDGRDIGTVVFPNAALKIFVTAEDIIRAKRRLIELKEKDIEIELDDVLQNLKHRDKIDSTRIDSPLKQADDAELLDTSHITRKEQLKQVLIMYEKLKKQY